MRVRDSIGDVVEAYIPNARQIDAGLKERGGSVRILLRPPGCCEVYLRGKLLDNLKRHGIGCKVHYLVILGNIGSLWMNITPDYSSREALLWTRRRPNSGCDSGRINHR